ncbi:hypothetical protein GE09DRAFT_1230144 [Coniochaeta sp. 2T2.1]|nr:hypothetical protein GE09DRAFT_1230144 [Coniochaeta sp. 2T2.1]
MSSAAFEAEMKLYIDAEFERRRHIRDMDESLQAILRDVLVEASEGMYLWIALQIEALFPLHATTLLSSADIPHLLENLPKDPPEAFDRALESIKDTRYGSRIFQLVAAARRPLTLDELRIALHVKSGDTNWNSTSIPDDGKAIIALCGGNLLEVDEEHETVHFIHHSVFRHLTNVVDGRDDIATGGSAQYYFRQSDADTHMGCLCVTYLNYSIFDTALTSISGSKMVLDTDHLTKGVTNLTLAKTGVATRIISAIRCRRAFGQQGVKNGELLQRYLEPKVDTADLLMFSSYAHHYWIEHTTRFWPSRFSDAYDLFTRL